MEFSLWIDAWVQERSKFPSLFQIKFPESVSAGDWVYVVLLPSLDKRDELSPEEFTDMYASYSYELPICLFNEELTERSATRLFTALKVIKDFQQTTPKEGLAFMSSVFVCFADWTRAQMGLASIFRSPTLRELHEKLESPAGQMIYEKYAQSPRSTLEHLLDFWAEFGSRFSKGWYDPVQNQMSTQIPRVLLEMTNLSDRISKYDTFVPVEVSASELGNVGNIVQDLAELQSDYFYKEGESWRVCYQGKKAILRDSKGVRCIFVLLQQPGNEFQVEQLEFEADSKEGYANRTISEEDLGRLSPDTRELDHQIDPLARRQYGDRIKALKEESEEARRNNDTERARKADLEIEQIRTELNRAFEQSGRPRKSGKTEHARKRVSQAITYTLGKIRESHPSLELHLRRSITTGVYCGYNPEPQQEWSFDNKEE